MNKTMLVATIVAFCSPAFAGKYVDGYVKSNGAYVAPHYRSSPDSNKYNNYSTQGNINPYTGKSGHVDPYRHQTYDTPLQPTYEPSYKSRYKDPYFEND